MGSTSHKKLYVNYVTLGYAVFTRSYTRSGVLGGLEGATTPPARATAMGQALTSLSHTQDSVLDTPHLTILTL